MVTVFLFNSDLMMLEAAASSGFVSGDPAAVELFFRMRREEGRAA